MDSHSKQPSQTSLFQVYLRLRPPLQAPALRLQQTEPWLIVEPTSPGTTANESSFEEAAIHSKPTHITLQPPNDSRKRAVEKFGFTKVFQEHSSQIDLFEQTGTVDLISNVLIGGRDGLVATLGVTGSGKSHTILGSRSERGVTQMTLDVIFRSLGCHIRRPDHPELPTDNGLLQALQAADPSEAQILSASAFFDTIYGDGDRNRTSRAQTPMMIGSRSRAETPNMVWHPLHSIPEETFFGSCTVSPSEGSRTPNIVYPDLAVAKDVDSASTSAAITPSIRLLPSKKVPHIGSSKPQVKSIQTSFPKKPADPKVSQLKEFPTHAPRRHLLPRSSDLPQSPDVAQHTLDIDPTAEYVVIVSMYEVYNDRIFDLLPSSLDSTKSQMTTRSAALQKELKRRPLLFKPTEMSLDRKLVVGLRKVVCGSYDEAMMVLETGLTERRVAGTGSNSVSSRSHGFFCIEVKKKSATRRYDDWDGGTLSIVDLAGSERARNARTAGATLAEAGKINESLMYLGQCLQMQSDCQQEGSKPTLVPFRQCKLTELLFSNSFPSSASSSTSQPHRNHPHHNHPQPQKAIMIVTADPLGDFNATSQILRYSALAREVTVPRIPSTTSTHILPAPGKGANAAQHPSRPETRSSEDLEAAHAEIARLDAEIDALAMRCAEEEILRREADLRAAAAEEKCLELEATVREDVWAEMEGVMEEERGKWREVHREERERWEGFVDGKVEIAVQAQQNDGLVKIYEDGDVSQEGRERELEGENELLKAKVAELEREVQGRSPTKSSSARAGKMNMNTGVRRSSPRKKTSTSSSLSITNQPQQHQPLGEIRNRSLLLPTTQSSPGIISSADPFYTKPNTDKDKDKDIKQEGNDVKDTTFTLGRLSLLPSPPFGAGHDTEITGAEEESNEKENENVHSPTGTGMKKLSLGLGPHRRQPRDTTSSFSTISSTLPSDLDMDLFAAFPTPPAPKPTATGISNASTGVSLSGEDNAEVGEGGHIAVPKTPKPPPTAAATTHTPLKPRVVSGAGASAAKKMRMRKLTTRKWDLGDEAELEEGF